MFVATRSIELSTFLHLHPALSNKSGTLSIPYDLVIESEPYEYGEQIIKGLEHFAKCFWRSNGTLPRTLSASSKASRIAWAKSPSRFVLPTGGCNGHFKRKF